MNDWDKVKMSPKDRAIVELLELILSEMMEMNEKLDKLSRNTVSPG